MKAATAKAPQFENILFATDFSPTAAHAIPFIKKIARHFQSNLVAVHVRSPVVNPMTQPTTWEADIEAAKAFDKEHRDELLDTFLGINTEVLVEDGDIQSRIGDAIQKHNTDLAIIGTRGRTGIAKVSQYVLNACGPECESTSQGETSNDTHRTILLKGNA